MPDPFHDPVNVLRVVDVRPSPALHLIESRARELVPAPVEPKDRTVRIRHPGELRNVVRERADELLACGERYVRRLSRHAASRPRPSARSAGRDLRTWWSVRARSREDKLPRTQSASAAPLEHRRDHAMPAPLNETARCSIESDDESARRHRSAAPDEADLHDRPGDRATDRGARGRRDGRRPDQLLARHPRLARRRCTCRASRRGCRPPTARHPDRPGRPEDPAG